MRKNYDYSLSYGLKKCDINENYNTKLTQPVSGINLKQFKQEQLPNKKILVPAATTTATSNKVVDIYLVNTATPIKFNERFGDQYERYNDFCIKNTLTRPVMPKNLFEPVEVLPSHSRINQNALYVANSKPLLFNNKQTFESLHVSKINVDNLDILNVEKKNNELLLRMRDKCKC